MSPIAYTFAVRDNAATPPGARVTGLSPAWAFVKNLLTNEDITPQPVIEEVAQGQYKFAFDSELHGEAAAQIDAGAALVNPADRYIDVLLTRDSGRTQAGISNVGKVTLDLEQAIPLNNTAQTVGDALNAARAIGFGKFVVDGDTVPPTMTFYAPDGDTVIRAFTLNDADNPSRRS